MLRKLAFTVLFLGFVTPAHAQDALVEDAGPALPYNSSFKPINLRPNAYISHRDNVIGTPEGGKSYPIAETPKPNSAKSYNQKLVNARQTEVRRKQSVIPSPFPDWYGQ